MSHINRRLAVTIMMPGLLFSLVVGWGWSSSQPLTAFTIISTDEANDLYACDSPDTIIGASVADIRQVDILAVPSMGEGTGGDYDTHIRVGLSQPITDFGGSNEFSGIEVFIRMLDDSSRTFRYMRWAGQEQGGEIVDDAIVPDTRRMAGANANGDVIFQTNIPMDQIKEMATLWTWGSSAFDTDFTELENLSQTSITGLICDRFPDQEGVYLKTGFGDAGPTRPQETIWTEVVIDQTTITNNYSIAVFNRWGDYSSITGGNFGTPFGSDPVGDVSDCNDPNQTFAGGQAADMIDYWFLQDDQGPVLVLSWNTPPGETLDSGASFDTTVQTQRADGSLITQLFRTNNGWLQYGQVDENFNVISGTQSSVSMNPNGSAIAFDLPQDTHRIDIISSTTTENGDRICDLITQLTPAVITDRINVGGNESGQATTFTGMGSPSSQNTFAIDDVAGDSQVCTTGAVVEGAPNDITGMSALPQDDGSWLVSVAMAASPEETADESFSYAVSVAALLNDGTTQNYLYQVHNFQYLIGRVDENFQLIAGTENLVNLGADNRSVEMTVTDSAESVTASAFYMDVSTGDRLCDFMEDEEGLVLPGDEEAQPEQQQVEMGPSPTPQTPCTIESGSTINLRVGPGTDYPIVGTWDADESAQVLAQTTGTDNFTWWIVDIVPEGMVFLRDDVVLAVGGCEEVKQLCDLAAQQPADAVTDTRAFLTCP